MAVNVELLQFYWQLGTDIAAQQPEERWGSGFLQRLSQDLMQAFPQVKGFSKRNLEQIRRWHRFWSCGPAIAKQVATQLFAIPWWHNVPMGKLPSIEALEQELNRRDDDQ